MQRYLLFIAIIACFRLFSQVPGELDINFGHSGKVIIDVGDLDHCEDIVMDDDLNTYFAGYTTNFGTTINTNFLIGKIAPNGNVDTTFASNGFYTGDFPKANASIIHEITLLRDGLLLFGSGVNHGIADTQYLYLSKISFDGTLDTSFADSGTFSGVFLSSYNAPGAMAVQNDGKIVICGAAYDSLTSQDVPLIGRLLPNGNPDTNFSNTGFKYWNLSDTFQDASNVFPNRLKHGAGGFLNDILILPNGNYFLSGYYNSGSTIHCLMLMVDDNANFISNFGLGGYAIFQKEPSAANKIIESVFYSNKIVMGIQLQKSINTNDFLMQSIMLNGTFIDTFSTNFKGYQAVLKDIKVIENELLLVGYSTLTENNGPGYDSDFFSLAKYNSSGNLSHRFANEGIFLSDFNTSDEAGATSLYCQQGKIVLAGYVNNISGNNLTDIGIMLVHNNTSTSIDKITNKHEINIYPNPANDLLTITSSVDIDHVSFYTLMGQQIKVDPINRYGNLVMDVSSLDKGLYFLELLTDKGSKKRDKIVIE